MKKKHTQKTPTLAAKQIALGWLAALAILSAATAGAQPAGTTAWLYNLHSNPLDKAAEASRTYELVPDAAEEFAIDIDPQAVADNPRTFLIDLPGGRTLEAIRTRFVEYREDWKSWVGFTREVGDKDSETGFIHLGYHGEQVTAVMDFAGERYRIVGGVEGSHRLVRLSDETGPLLCAYDDAKGLQKAMLEAESASASEAPIMPETAALTANRIDVLAVYPKAFFDRSAAEESSLFTFIEDSISLANTVFANSLVDTSYNLVGIVPLKGASQPSQGPSNSLTWLTNLPSEVTTLRNAFGADVVAIYVPFSWSADNFCGVANLPQNNNTFVSSSGTVNAPMGDRAFSAHRNNCGLGDFTLGHEIGHNYGMYHGDQPASPLAIFPYGRGNSITVAGVAKATVIACAPVCPPTGCVVGSAPICNRIPYFSDPNIFYMGVATGTADRNNTQVARIQTPVYAGFRAQSTNTPPTANFTSSCSGGTCTFNASSSTDNTALPSNGPWWDFGDGSTGTGVSKSHFYQTAGSYRVHLVVTDGNGTTGQTDVAWGSVNPSPLYEGYHDIGNCRDLFGWAWDQGSPNTSVNVDVYRDSTKVSTVPANLFRQDLVNAGKGNGSHGFDYHPNSSWKNGQWHTGTVKFTGSGANLSTTPKSIICAVSLFPGLTPTDNLDTAGVVYTVATQFSSTVSGYITALRFYRAAGETGTNVGKLWSNSGAVLAQQPFPGSPSSGWVEVPITPVAITAGTLYRVGVNTNVRQSKTGRGIGSGITNEVLTAHSGYWIAGNGIFPTTGSCSNFFVDVKFDL